MDKQGFNPKHKVGIVTTWFDRGAAFVSKQIMEVLLPEFDVFIYARGEKYENHCSYWNLENVHWGKRVYWVGSGKIDKRDFIGWLKDKGIETLIFNEQRWWQPILWAKEHGVKVGAYIDYYTPESLENFSVYDFLICNTLRHFEAFSWHNGARFVKWGTNTAIFKPKDYDLHDPFVFFHSSGMDSFRKGTDLLVEAFNKIKNNINAKLVIHSQVDPKLGDKDLSKVVIIQKTVPPPGLFHLGDIYVYPSRLDGLGLTVCEALSCGLPVITTNSQPMSEFVEEGITGFLVDVKSTCKRKDNYFWPITEVSVDSLAAKMLYTYQNKHHLSDLKQNARKYVIEHRDWSKNSLIIREIVKKSPYFNFDPLIKSKLSRFDQRDLKGKFDLFLEIPLARELGEFLVRYYRKLRQPHFYV
jgi:1,2-diacylglycerol 3-alpha-glucosyltransferase